MLLIIISLCLLITSVTHSQRSETIASANRSIDKAVPDYKTISHRSWFGPNGISDFLDLMTKVNNNFALNASSLFDAPDASTVYTALLLPNSQTCLPNTTFGIPTVEAFAFYGNETMAEVYLCCQISIFNSPGVNRFLFDLQQTFFGNNNMWQGFENDVSILISNVAELRSVVAQSIITGACKDDKRIHYYETQILRAELIAKIMGLLMKVYTYSLTRIASTTSCLQYPAAMTGCLQNITTSLIDTPAPDYQFLPFDNFYQQTCGYSALASFENFRNTPISCSSKKK